MRGEAYYLTWYIASSYNLYLLRVIIFSHQVLVSMNMVFNKYYIANYDIGDEYRPEEQA